MGLLGRPYGLEEDVLPGLQWAPVRDAPDGWVQLGAVGTCSMNLNLQSPREENEGLTRYVMCCAGTAKAEAGWPAGWTPSSSAAGPSSSARPAAPGTARRPARARTPSSAGGNNSQDLCHGREPG